MKKGIVIGIAGLCVGALGAVAAYTSNNRREELMKENTDLIFENAHLRREVVMKNRVINLETLKKELSEQMSV